MRGKVNQFANVFTAAWITPAYAGKSPCIYRFSCVGWDHPRICGEKHFEA